ncbi:BTAD domain-containing putative transcriptional regulator [Nonomuraea sp. MCN248]|uniref:BTAD domain-containing putative transcriptional regulator n=1 Tax=Nonomuraea corallina TaxID=2989783 RepID=A0ABT4SBP9_9ACTN|nr:BTAD domain-containing putative transcriptional regulator [Nonomuraea corallina]MDA0634361.1 BTAD domain-containing putative transcriptional regulator [Nonomuraea corallina]
MRFAILGRLQVECGDEPVEITRTRRSLLATLLLAGSDGIVAETLMQAVWGDTYGRENSLKTALSQLRQLLPGRIPSARGHGYRIVLRPEDSFDLTEFRLLAEEGRVRIATGDQHAAVASLRRALDLWGDPPLADVPEDPIRLATWRQELLWERKVAQQDLLKARLKTGEHQQLLGDLRRELAEDPLSEMLNALLMTALHRAGYRMEALRHYDGLVTLLAQEAGADPGARLRRLRDEIVNDTLDLRTLDENEQATSATTWGTGGLAPAQLPPAVSDFTGRAAEMEELTRYLRTAGQTGRMPIASISGPPGVGKSALAHQVAHLLRPHFPDGQVYVHLAGMSDQPREITDVLGEVLAALGVELSDVPATVPGRTALYRSVLAGRRVLVVLDDVSGMHQVDPLLPGTPGCAVMVTSRAHLVGGAGMRMVRLEPLSSEESLTLLGEIIGAERIRSDAVAAADIVDACGGLPLAVRIAGARLSGQPHWPLAMFVTRLRKRLLSMLQADGMTVEASIADSYESLPDPEARVFRLASLLRPGGFAGWEVAMLGGGDIDDVEEVLERLSRRSLLTMLGVDSLGQPRYHQHDLLRVFAAARLAERPNERDRAIHRLMLGWLELASLADEQIAREPHDPPVVVLEMVMFAPADVRQSIVDDADGWLATEAANLLYVIRIVSEHGLHRLAMGLALRVTSYLYRESRHRDAADMWRHLLQSFSPTDARMTAEVRHRLAALIMQGPGGAQRALPLLDDCVQGRESSGDLFGLARSLALRAVCRRQLSSGPDHSALLSEAEADAGRGLRIAREIANRHAELVCLRAMATVLSARGEHERALALGHEAVTAAEQLAEAPQDRSYLRLALQTLATLMLNAGHAEPALRLSEQARELSVRLRHRAGQAQAQEAAGDALAALGRRQEADEQYRDAAATFEADGGAEDAKRCRAKLAG